MAIDEITIHEILSRIDIVDIISGSVHLKQAGKNYKGLCPFHLEKTPSFTINTLKQTFHCFGCGASGDAISFVMKQDNLSFLEALRKLAQIAGVQIISDTEFDPFAQKKNELFKLHSIAGDWFHENLLNKTKSKTALQYLEKRGINEETQLKFKLGLALEGWTFLYDFLHQNGYSDDFITESGLCLRSPKSGRLYDRFRNRIIFPIFDPHGRITGFSGRILESASSQKDPAKYMNSPETPIFKKNQLLYGMFQARENIAKRNIAILCEGHLDVCALHQHGFTETLGVQGTAFTEEHAKWICRYTKNMNLIFDGDSAGIKAALRVLPISLSNEMNAKMILLPEKEDPASFLLTHPREEFQKFITFSKPLYEFKVKHLLGAQELTPEIKVSIANQMIEDLNHVKNSVLLDSLIQETANQLHVDPFAIKSQFDKIKSFHKKNWAPSPDPASKTYEEKLPSQNLIKTLTAGERELLKCLLFFPDTHETIFNKLELEWILHKEASVIAEHIFNLFCEKMYNSDQLNEFFKTKPEYLPLFQWLKENNVHSENIHQAVEDLLKRLELDYYKNKREMLENLIKEKYRNNENYLPLMHENTILSEKIKNLQ